MAQPQPTTRAAASANFYTTDAAWQAELVRQFGKQAGDKRYLPEGKGAPGSALRTLYAARDAARIIWEQAHGLAA